METSGALIGCSESGTSIPATVFVLAVFDLRVDRFGVVFLAAVARFWLDGLLFRGFLTAFVRGLRASVFADFWGDCRARFRLPVSGGVSASSDGSASVSGPCESVTVSGLGHGALLARRMLQRTGRWWESSVRMNPRRRFVGVFAPRGPCSVFLSLLTMLRPQLSGEDGPSRLRQFGVVLCRAEEATVNRGPAAGALTLLFRVRA